MWLKIGAKGQGKKGGKLLRDQTRGSQMAWEGGGRGGAAQTLLN